MGLLGRLLKFVVTRGLVLAALAALLLLVPGLPPYTTFSEQHLTPTLPREGILAPNSALDGAKQLLRDKLHGPEALQVHNGELYTSLGSGEIVKLSPGGHVTFVTKIGQPCEGPWQEPKCGRPLGFRIDASGRYVYVADAYYGVWRVELATDRRQLLVSPRVAVGGRVPRLINSIALAKNGDFYWTDSSSDFQLQDGSYTSLVDPSGRLFHYNAAKNESRVLLDGLWFANGVAVSPSEEFVIVAETFASMIHRVYVNGPKKGQKDIFVNGLPGTPDNLQPLEDGSGVLVTLYTVFDAEHPLVSRSLARFPLVRKLAARLQRLVELPFEYLQQQYPHYIFESITSSIGSFKSLSPMIPKQTGIIQLDWSGNIVGAWFSQDGSLVSISDAIVYKDLLYFGSPINPYVATIAAPEQLKRAFTKQKTSPPSKAPEPVKKPLEKVKPGSATKAPEIVQKSTDVPVQKKVEEPLKSKKEEPAKPVVIEKNIEPKELPKATLPQKPKVEKSVEEPHKTTHQPKPAVQQTKTTETPKSTTPKPASKTESKPTVPPKKETPRKVESPKIVETPRKVETPKNVETPKKPVETVKQAPKSAQKEEKKPTQIPIVEDIAVDTARPNKEPLKVIKREGPAEIPHPAL